MNNKDIYFWRKNFRFNFGEHDVVNSYKKILNRKFNIIDLDEIDVSEKKIILFDEFSTREKSLDIERLKSKNNQITLILTEYFVSKKVLFKEKVFINYFENSQFSIVISYFERLIRKVFRQKLLNFFISLAIFLYFQYYFFYIDQGILIKLILSVILFCLIFPNNLKFLYESFFPISKETTYFSDRLIGIKKISNCIDTIIFADQNVEASYLDNKQYLKFLDQKYKYEINLLEDCDIDLLDIGNISFNNIMIFGEKTKYRVSKYKNLIRLLNNENIIDKVIAKKMVKNFSGTFKDKVKNNGIGIIIPKKKNILYLSTGAILRHVMLSNLPFVYCDFEPKSQFKNIKICISDHDVINFFKNFELNFHEFKSEMKFLKDKAIKNNTIILDKISEL